MGLSKNSNSEVFSFVVKVSFTMDNTNLVLFAGLAPGEGPAVGCSPCDAPAVGC